MDDKLKNEQDGASTPEVPEGAVEIPVEVVETGPMPDSEEDMIPGAEEPDAGADTEQDRVVRLEEQCAALSELLRAAQEEHQNFVMRSQAEFENYRKRLTRERDEHLKYAAEKVMKDLVPTLDNLEMAVTYGSRDETCADMLQGVMMTQKLLIDALGKHGLTRFGETGEAFNPSIHEALGFECNPELPPDSVARVMQSGYSLHGRLLRPAKVNVNKV